MAEIRRSSIKNQVYEIIKDKILYEEYRLGEAINITALCKELSISNSPIREALSLLETEGLVTSALNTKYRVIELTEKSLSDINQTFCVLCCGGLDICVTMGTQEKLVSLLQNAFAEQKDALQDKDHFRFIQCAIAFDKCFIKATGNEIFLSTFNSLSARLFLAVRYNHQGNTNSRQVNIGEHEQILAQVKSGNYDIVKALLLHHYDKHVYAEHLPNKL